MSHSSGISNWLLVRGPLPAATVLTAVAALTVAGIGVARAEHGPAGATFCQRGDTIYLCGEIWVELRIDAGGSIEDVVARNGGDATDVLYDVLSVEATSTEVFYAIAVEIGHEPWKIEQYIADPDVAQVILSTEGVGAGAQADLVVDDDPPMPDTAIPAPMPGSGK